MQRLAAVAGAVALALACSPVAALPRDLLQTSPAATTVIAESNAVQLTANITSLNSNAEYVNVTFTGVPTPSVNDAIAYIVPANATYSQTAPQKFKWASVGNPNYLQTGSGYVTFRILNSRQSFKFILVTNVSASTSSVSGGWTTGNFTLLAETPAISIKYPDAPSQIHLALTNITGQAKVQWTTTNRTPQPTVQYGTTPGGPYPSSAVATTDTFTSAQLCGGIANSTGYIYPGILNTATMQNLTASTTYYYRVGDSSTNTSAELSFLTAPAPGSNDLLQIIVTADMGYCEVDSSLEWEASYPNPITTTPPGTLQALKTQFNNAYNGNWLSFCAGRQVANAIINDQTNKSLFLLNGDISYAQGFAYGWDVYMDQVQPVVSKVPFMVVQGNHERDFPGTGDRYEDETAKDSGGECGVVAEKRFPAPIPAPGQQWYSYGVGSVYFIAFSTELDFAQGSDQHRFIFNTLKSVNRTTYPWLVVNLHRPYLLPSVYGNNDKSDIYNQFDLDNAFADLFLLYQVDLTIFGHTHWYSRSCSQYKRTCLPPAADGSQQGTAHVNVGNAGASFSWDVLDPALLSQNLYTTVAVAHGYSKMNVTRTALSFQAVNSADGSLIDQFTLTKPANWTTSYTRQSNLMKTFIGNFTYTWEELYGADSYQSQILDAAETALFNSQTASNDNVLTTLANMTRLVNPITGPDAFESYQTANPVWQALDTAFQQYVLTNSSITPTTIYYYRRVYGPILEMFRQFPSGIFKGPFASAPAPAPATAGVANPANNIELVFNPSTVGSAATNSSIGTAPAAAPAAVLTDSGVASSNNAVSSTVASSG